jgi:hypothetical protein
VEKRKSGRRPLKVFVDHILGERERCLCVSEDVSAGGIQVSGLPGPGWGRPRHVWLQFQLPDAQQSSVRALGELRYEHASDDGTHVRGYRFKYMSPRERCLYNDFLQGEQRAAAV